MGSVEGRCRFYRHEQGELRHVVNHGEYGVTASRCSYLGVQNLVVDLYQAEAVYGMNGVAHCRACSPGRQAVGASLPVCSDVRTHQRPPSDRLEVGVGALECSVVCVVMAVQKEVSAEVMVLVVGSITCVGDGGVGCDAHISASGDDWDEDSRTI